MCKCGETFEVGPNNKHKKYKSGHFNRTRKGKDAPNYKGLTKRINSHGYVLIRIGKVWKLEHRVIMEEHLRRKLKSWEVIHHKDHNKQNNDISNLDIMTNNLHSVIHFRL